MRRDTEEHYQEDKAVSLGLANSILDYYQKALDRYYVAKDISGNVVHVWEPMGRKIVVSRYEQFDLFICKVKSSFMIYEGLTGALIISQTDLPTRQLRRCNIKQLTAYLPLAFDGRGGAAELNILIVNFIEKYEQKISPRYISKTNI